MDFKYTQKWQKLSSEKLPFKINPLVVCVLFVVCISLLVTNINEPEEEALESLSADEEIVAQVEVVAPEPVEEAGSEVVFEEEHPLPKQSGVYVLIEKNAHKLIVLHDGEKVKEYGVAVGRNNGDKQRVGDMRTPEGAFSVQQIQDASGWSHDFRDGKGAVSNAYGPIFIRLRTGKWSGIGIHGTHDPKSIGTDTTEGCIRLNNNDLIEFRKLIAVGTNVTINP
ncbi:MAG: L,D-transpeptidase [Synergistaceae bacterium]|jgi:hypothetical protein|nr:L,D-transpeptidase [Synergistaceae bacterium]